jgi:hypothetical protein
VVVPHEGPDIAARFCGLGVTRVDFSRVHASVT